MTHRHISGGDSETYDYWLARDAWTASEVQFLMGGYWPDGQDSPQHPDIFVRTVNVLNAGGQFHSETHVVPDPATSHTYLDLLEDAVSAGVLKSWSRISVTGSPRLYPRDVEMRFDPAEIIAWVQTLGPRICQLFPFRWVLDRRLLLRQGLFGRELEEQLKRVRQAKHTAIKKVQALIRTADEAEMAPASAEGLNPTPPIRSWQPKNPERVRGYGWPLYRVLLQASRDGKPVPSAREVLDVFAASKPQEIASVQPDEVAYYTADGNVKTANARAIQKAINRACS